jgi:hypothetical protein
MLDPSTLYSTMFSNAWPFLLFILLLLFFKSPWMKGKIGEAIVNATNTLVLDKEIYVPVKDVTLQLSDGSTSQIDHILVSKYGLFVIETKNMKGWIFGGEHQKEWTQQIFKQKNKFQNPLNQNYRHLKALEEILEVAPSALTSVIAFVGECEFKTPMPENVFRGISYTKYITSFKAERLNPLQIRQILSKLQRKRLEQSFKTDRVHVENLKQRMQTATSIRDVLKCSRCSSPMVLRKSKKTGEEFYGCSTYPRCKHTVPIA